MGDIGNILASAGITGSSAGQQAQPRGSKNPAAVGGEGAIAPLAATFLNRVSSSRGSAKSSGQVTKYALIPFTNSARSDGLSLRHWRRAGSAKGADYEFAKFNHEVRMVQYSDEEWEALKLGEEPDKDGHVWSRGETDALFSLCYRYSLRWPVIADRFVSSTGTTATENQNENTAEDGSAVNFGSLEQLKDRYYSIAKSVLEYRYSKETKTGPAPARVDARVCTVANEEEASAAEIQKISILQPGPVEAKILMAFDYDLASERDRLNYLKHIFDKKTKDEDEEQKLKDELKWIDIQIKKLKDDSSLMEATTKSRMASTLRGRQSVVAQPFSRKAGGAKSAGTARTSSIRAANSHASAGGRGALGSVTTRLPAANFGPLLIDAPVYLRSVRLESEATDSTCKINAKMLQKMHMVLQELGVPARPIPTKRVCDAYDNLRRDILTILAAKKHMIPKHRAKANAKMNARHSEILEQRKKDMVESKQIRADALKVGDAFRRMVSNPHIIISGNGKKSGDSKSRGGKAPAGRGKKSARGRGKAKANRTASGAKGKKKKAALAAKITAVATGANASDSATKAGSVSDKGSSKGPAEAGGKSAGPKTSVSKATATGSKAAGSKANASKSTATKSSKAKSSGGKAEAKPAQQPQASTSEAGEATQAKKKTANRKRSASSSISSASGAAPAKRARKGSSS